MHVINTLIIAHVSNTPTYNQEESIAECFPTKANTDYTVVIPRTRKAVVKEY